MTSNSRRNVDARGVLAVVGEFATEPALRSAIRAASALGGRLDLVRVLPTPSGADEGSEIETGSGADAEEDDGAEFGRWIAETMQTDRPLATHTLRNRTSFVETVSICASDRNVQLIVLVGVPEAHVAATTELAHSSRRPVLLARPMTDAAPVVLVATLLSDDELPVVHYGVDWARRLAASVALAHNAYEAAGVEPPAKEGARNDLERRASELAHETGLGIDVVFGQDPSVEAMLLTLVAERHATLLVLGSYPRSGLTGLLIPSVSSAVLQRASCSVVVMPLSCELA